MPFRDIKQLSICSAKHNNIFNELIHKTIKMTSQRMLNIFHENRVVKTYPSNRVRLLFYQMVHTSGLRIKN